MVEVVAVPVEMSAILSVQQLQTVKMTAIPSVQQQLQTVKMTTIPSVQQLETVKLTASVQQIETVKMTAILPVQQL